MSDGAAVTAVLARTAPAVARCLSPLGRALAFPQGIPAQAAEARSATLKATVGQVTTGDGRPLPLAPLARLAEGLDPATTFKYSPQPGHEPLRKAWLDRQRRLAGPAAEGVACTPPFATHGLTHGIATVADLFVDADTTVLLPEPSWENYQLLFTLRGTPKMASWRFFDDHGGLDLEAFDAALSEITGKAVVVLNFPSNPTGYCPTPAEVDALVERLTAHPHPAVYVVDDAYQGVVFEPDRVSTSVYWPLAASVDPDQHVVIKVDGATKELLFFPSRVGFLTASFDDPEAVAAWEDKLNALVRGTVGSPPGPSQAMILEALRDPDGLDAAFAEVLALLETRYHAVQRALDATRSGKLHPYPFQGAYFCLVGLPEGLDPHAVRRALIEEASVGLIALPEVNALRIAFCSAEPEDLAEMVARLDALVARL